MNKDDIKQKWEQSQIQKEWINAQRKYKDVNDLWKQYFDSKIDYDEFEDALLGMELLKKITPELRKKLQDKAEKIEEKNLEKLLKLKDEKE